MKEESFKVKFAYLQKIYGKALDKDVYAMYWEQLKEYDEETFHVMVTNLVKTFIPTTQVPFPLLPHFLKACGDDIDNRSQNALTALKSTIKQIGNWKSVSFGDRALHATIERFGGWIKICEWSQDNWNYNEKRFIQCYEAECRSVFSTGPDRLIGVFESHNSENMHKFSDRQREIAEKQNETAQINWQGYKDLQLEAPEEKLQIENIGKLPF
ncbi:MAG: DUF6475 domain-containing protein [Desulfobacterales bacterium]